MINILNFETAHHHGDALPTLLKLRYSEFVERQKYEVPVYNGMEYDQYDTPAAIYIVWRDSHGKMRAGTRIIPTNRPYMIKDLWPDSVQYIDLPSSPTVWEITRFFVDKNMDDSQRQQAHGEILCAYLEFALHHGVESYIGTAPPRLWKHTLIKCGWPVEFVGEVTEIGFSEKIQTGVMHVSPQILENVRTTMGIQPHVLSEFELPMEKVA
ncbi:MAG: autoinducer synthase [Alphaproteobacteria bacterium]|nr:autoinducer synthase [Alphaproteobacteria bacterium]